MKTLTLYPQPITPNSFAQSTVPCQKPDFTALEGQPKWQIIQNLLRLDLDFIEFVHWLAIPSCDILLHFDHQICRHVCQQATINSKKLS